MDVADDEVLAANQAFYEAFRGEDYAAMEALWARAAPVACIHPGWPALVGRSPVMASWRGILTSGAPPIRAEAPRVQRLGDVAYVICDELVPGGRLVATNVFVLEGGGWKMVHHHAGPVSDVDGADEDEESEPETPGTIN
jgi:ketosteroid isomerase-like protein